MQVMHMEQIFRVLILVTYEVFSHFYVLKLVILRIHEDGGNGLCNFMFLDLFILRMDIFIKLHLF